jgi:hypothetical protein
MLRIGCIILSIEGGFQFIVSVISLVASIMGKYAPILKMTLTDNEIEAASPKLLVTTKALTIMHNSGATLLSFIVVVLIWTCLIHGYKWSFWLLLFVGIFGHTFWYIGDSFIGNKTLIVNSILTALFAVGISFAGYGILGCKS